ncbi:ribose/xylose/arabinose/galactoside ABC-type transport system, permease component [Gynuella sunshinyii YC6258]|uniref:Autoinducer 2 import system permease protein LsrD n=2 Tax=Gynuella sunshinyii TaxID=1445505 RepID=A0A0C5VB57_9GAMM|nr:ribose/xylose/arabinose/galactoside ABC-type transport system, permease component [Gynuella sunshinyii YC6258]
MDQVMKHHPVPDSLSTPVRRYLFRWEIFLLLVIAMVFILNSLASPYFLDPWNLSDATFNFTEKALIALPMAMLIICREIDLSVASTMALASVCMGLAAQAGFGTETLVGIALLVGLLCGLFNGLVVTGFGIPSIVVTIGTMSLYRGITYVILGDSAFTEYPDGFEYFGQGYVVWVFSFEFILFLGLALVFYVLLHHTNFGRRTYAIGHNPVAALYSGIQVNRHKVILFMLVGMLSGLASILLTSRLGSTRPSIAIGWELSIVTMVVLGGVSIAGGAGSMTGVVLAVLLMGLVTFGLGLLNVPGIVMTIIIGAMLISVISVPVVLNKLKQRRKVR